MSEYTDQLAAIEAHLLTITDVGLVHTFPRLGSANEHWVTKIGGFDTVRAWEIGVIDPGTEVQRLQQSWLHRYRTWRIRGYVSIAPEEEGHYGTLLDLAELIQEAIDADQRLTGPANEFPAGTCLDHDPVQTSAPEPIQIGGGPICWTADLTFRAWTIVQ